MTNKEGWASITVEFLGSTDSKTVGHGFETLRGLNVRVKVRHQSRRDMRIVTVLARQGNAGGFLLSPIDDDGESTANEQQFVGYEDIEAIGVY